MNGDGRGRSAVVEGVDYDLIPYGRELASDGSPLFSKPCHVCGSDPGQLHRPTCNLGPLTLYARPERCRDCSVGIGDVHRLTCGIEQCPRCRGQYMSCQCRSNEDVPD